MPPVPARLNKHEIVGLLIRVCVVRRDVSSSEKRGLLWGAAPVK